MNERILKSPWDGICHSVILIVEDSDEDFYTLIRSIKQLNFYEEYDYSLLRFENGDDALDYLLRQGEYIDLQAAYPVLILLDLNLPGTDGRELIQHIKGSSKLKSIPIVVLTTSQNEKDVETCYKLGANSYFLKPMGIKAMQNTIKILFDYWLKLAVIPNATNFSS